MSRPLAVALALCAVSVTNITTDRSEASEDRRVTETSDNLNSSEIFARSLRRQLIKDNYDYISNESDDSAKPRVKGEQHHDETVEEEKIITGVVEDTTEKLNSDSNNVNPKNKFKQMNKMKNDSPENKYEGNDDKSSKHKVRGKRFRISGKRRNKGREYMYDINEDLARRYQSRYSVRISHEDVTATEGSVEQTTTVKYKVLKLRTHHRRSGLPAALIQEESPAGVSIVNLGNGPVPEFRLLGPRRQYMQAPHPLKAVGDEEEVPPPPADDTTTADDTQTETNTQKPSTLDNPVNSNDELLNALKITETPDEIFVL